MTVPWLYCTNLPCIWTRTCLTTLIRRDHKKGFMLFLAGFLGRLSTLWFYGWFSPHKSISVHLWLGAICSCVGIALRSLISLVWPARPASCVAAYRMAKWEVGSSRSDYTNTRPVWTHIVHFMYVHQFAHTHTHTHTHTHATHTRSPSGLFIDQLWHTTTVGLMYASAYSKQMNN